MGMVVLSSSVMRLLLRIPSAVHLLSHPAKLCGTGSVINHQSPQCSLGDVNDKPDTSLIEMIVINDQGWRYNSLCVYLFNGRRYPLFGSSSAPVDVEGSRLCRCVTRLTIITLEARNDPLWSLLPSALEKRSRVYVFLELLLRTHINASQPSIHRLNYVRHWKKVLLPPKSPFNAVLRAPSFMDQV